MSQKSYYNDIKCHMTLDKIFSLVTMSERSYSCWGVQRDGQKVNKRARFWVPWKGHWLYSNFCLQALINRSIYDTHMGWERILHHEFTIASKSSKYWILLVKIVWACKTSLHYHTCTTQAKLLKILEMGWSTVVRKKYC